MNTNGASSSGLTALPMGGASTGAGGYMVVTPSQISGAPALLQYQFSTVTGVEALFLQWRVQWVIHELLIPTVHHMMGTCSICDEYVHHLPDAPGVD